MNFLAAWAVVGIAVWVVGFSMWAYYQERFDETDAMWWAGMLVVAPFFGPIVGLVIGVAYALMWVLRWMVKKRKMPWE